MVAARYLPPWFSVAPMMEWTDNHYRTLARLISKHAWLYTEMLAAETIVFQKGNLDRFLAYTPEQHPIVLQIGGSNLENLAKATELANAYSYDEINFNCGCPSPRVAGHGCFGVRLMLDPKESLLLKQCQLLLPTQVFRLVLSAVLVLTITIHIMSSVILYIRFLRNHQLGISSYMRGRHCSMALAQLIIEKIPPLKYEYYYALLRDFPDLRFTINGGINGVNEVNAARGEGAHGVMVGRAAYHNPWNTLGHVDTAVYGVPPTNLTRRQVLEKYQAYGESELRKYGLKPNVRDVIRPLFWSFPLGAWKWLVEAQS
ncbi:FMN-linked oxidoreductases superfamily protein [Actinidia rufa]|uniref:tRNA-dihydrouridine synthase n=1 Tax=Actinidia rufa TaxID=165716 RepID=A0A7J0FP55_9ERIC|nr:FMN-linked oxidoreductases superfamily protein [Actinidia rufa]